VFLQRSREVVEVRVVHDSLVFPFFDLDQPVKRFAIVVLSLGREKKTLGFRVRADELALS